MTDYRAPRTWKQRLFEDATLAQGPLEIEQTLSALQKETGLSAITLRVCLARGLRTTQAIRDHLNPKFEGLHHPLSIRDMDKATTRLAESRETGERILVFGDYDVDGTTGAALLAWVFRDLGLQFEVRQPDRFKDGYGLNIRAVEEAAEREIGLIVTVDCGITSFDAIHRAQELGIDVVIVDHHQLDAKLGMPEAYAVINPQRPDCESGLRELCGCGLAFYLSMGLRIKGREEGWFEGVSEPNLKQHLDLVVLATAADMVPLTGDNHILVRQGMDVLKHTKKPGFRAMLDLAGVGSKDLSPGHLGFVLGPRINASGRMQSASLALELLTTTDPLRGSQLALELEKLNTERADLQNQIWDEVRAKVELGISLGKFKNSVVVADAGWHEGVVGIVASRVTETFRRPAAVISIREDMAKGSVRSFGGKDVLGALRSSSEWLLGFGGHKHAAGLTLEPQNLDQFTEAFDQALEKVAEDTLGTPLLVEGECEISDLNLKTLEELESLGPFGPGNPEPVFTFKASVLGHRVLKERHLKMQLGEANKNAIEAIWFHAAQERDLGSKEFLGCSEWAGVPELNRFRGHSTPTVRVRDWRPLEV